MKRFALFIALLLPLVALSQNDISRITAAISSGNAATIGSFFNDEVDLTVLDDEDIYSKTEAVNLLKSFFSGVTGKNFEIKHEGTSKLNHQYYIGDFTTTSNEKYRVTFFVKSANGQSKISQFRIEEF